MPDWLSESLVLTAWGMGFVFAVLGSIAALLRLLVRLDTNDAAEHVTPHEAAAETGPDPKLVAAVMIAVRAHIRVRRKQAAPAMRAHAPGSLPSRWTSIGRGRQVRGW